MKVRVKCSCGWSGVRKDSPSECCCYDEWAVVCTGMSPGPGCPRPWLCAPCPKCGLKPWRQRTRAEKAEDARVDALLARELATQAGN